jgi:hypothetical protein
MSETPRQPSKFDPYSWANGDPDELVPFQDELYENEELCDRTFATKRAALCAGYRLGFIAAERGVAS